MRATLVLSGLEGGTYTLQFELQAIPRPGDHIFISKPHQAGTEEFVVRRISWYLHHPEEPNAAEHIGESRGLTIDCEKTTRWEPAWAN